MLGGRLICPVILYAGKCGNTTKNVIIGGKKVKQNKGIKTGWEMPLNREVSGGLSEEVTVEQRPNQ